MASKKAASPKPKSPRAPKTQEKQSLALESELQSVRLELEEKQQQLEASRHELDLRKRELEQLVDQEVRQRLEKLCEQLSGPVAQLTTQNDLHHVQGKTLKPQDVLLVATKLVHSLESVGLEVNEKIGAVVSFDKAFHESVSMDDGLRQGENAIVRMVGVSFNGKVLRRAAVMKLPPEPKK